MNNTEQFSKTSLDEHVEYLRKLVATFNENVESILGGYSSLALGALSSSNIDATTQMIKSKIKNFNADFEELANSIQNTITTSSEANAASTSKIESNLSSLN